MKKFLLHACTIGIISLGACGNPPTYDTTAPVPSTALPATAVATDSSVIGTGTTPATGSQQAIPSLPANTTTAALNPEHGKPGHRCDIAVGAPLNSPSQPTQQAPAPAPMQTLPSLPQPTNSGGGVARLNPPHGEPGHDCAVQVGQPLNN